MGYSVEVCKKLGEKIRSAKLFRPMHIKRYDDNTELEYNIVDVDTAVQAKIKVLILRFVGGGFAGQVYQVKLLKIEGDNGSIETLKKGGIYAIKILIPPSGFSLFFRNLLYAIGFQGPFQLQSNPVAARSGALWQKFIRRAAKIKFGDERSVTDIYATFVDSRLGSCGEISEWIEGRTWRLEVDERLDVLRKWFKGKPVDPQKLGSPEYRNKYQFMHQFVDLLHEVGAHEFARQYEWSTWKSQPNCLKRKDTEASPTTGLVAVDFRAGLALLPFLPMSPGDFKLIIQGLFRGSLVQFDRGDVGKLETYIAHHPNEFQGMERQLQELKESEEIYRASVPDITHNHLKLLYSKKLWSTLLKSAVTGWKVKNLVDDQFEQKLHGSIFRTILFWIIGIIPFFGHFIRRFWGQESYRKHYLNILTSGKYLWRAIRAKATEYALNWYRAERVNEKKALQISERVWPIIYHLPFSLLPVGLHKIFTDWQYAKGRLNFIFVRPFRLYFNAHLREEWLRDMVTGGKKKHILTDEDSETILSQIKEPFIQKYLKSLAVHVLTVPVTQIVSVMIAAIYIMTHPELPRHEAYAIGLGIIALFQVVPISPGSLARGLYVVYLVIKERNFKDYNIAVFLAFFKYIGYLAFPIQMTYRYPALARFMAGHWATEAVHIVPVFGEGGALLEHKVFNLFYNWPLTIRGRMGRRAKSRRELAPRSWHISLIALVGATIFGVADYFYLSHFAELPTLKTIWWLTLFIPLLGGVFVTLAAGGAKIGKRVTLGAISGFLTAVFYTAITAALTSGSSVGIAHIVAEFLWRIFIFAILSVISVLLTEAFWPETEKQPAEAVS